MSSPQGSASQARYGSRAAEVPVTSTSHSLFRSHLYVSLGGCNISGSPLQVCLQAAVMMRARLRARPPPRPTLSSSLHQRAGALEALWNLRTCHASPDGQCISQRQSPHAACAPLHLPRRMPGLTVTGASVSGPSGWASTNVTLRELIQCLSSVSV
eukprot:COSAG01_NODE_1812_length_9179_cov_36.648789_6_plen_156_part_00